MLSSDQKIQMLDKFLIENNALEVFYRNAKSQNFDVKAEIEKCQMGNIIILAFAWQYTPQSINFWVNMNSLWVKYIKSINS